MKRKWIVPIDVETGEGMPQLQEAVMDLTTILLRLGGVGAVAPHRIEVAENEYEVSHFVLHYDSYAPGLNAAEVLAADPGEENDEDEDIGTTNNAKSKVKVKS